MKDLMHRSYWLLLSGMVLACGQDEAPPSENSDPVITAVGTPAGAPVSAVMDAGGGTLQSADGQLSVDIPAGALTTATTVTLQPITNEAPLGLGTAYRLQPEGLTFSKPVHVTFHYDEQITDGSPEDFLWVVTQAGDGSWNAVVKSNVDTNAKTVTIETTHFSDWSLGRFVELSLVPASRTLKPGESLELHIRGFKHGDPDQELVPLSPITGNGEGLTPLTTIPPVQSRLQDFRVKGWMLNNVAAPVSNDDGSLTASGKGAKYTAPSKMPKTNPVAVTVELQGANKEGKKIAYRLTSNIRIADAAYYLAVSIGGRPFQYVQYGEDDSGPEDESDFFTAQCTLDGTVLTVLGTELIEDPADGIGTNNVFGFVIGRAEKGPCKLACGGNTNDDMSFLYMDAAGGKRYDLRYVERKGTPEDCKAEAKCSSITVELLEYTGESFSEVRGKFSGYLYDDTGASAKCKTSEPLAVEGEFRLKLQN